MANDKLDTSEITKRLDIVIYLLLKQNKEKDSTTRQTINELSNLGLKYGEIAKILGRSGSYVASELTLLKKLKKKTKEVIKNE